MKLHLVLSGTFIEQTDGMHVSFNYSLSSTNGWKTSNSRPTATTRSNVCDEKKKTNTQAMCTFNEYCIGWAHCTRLGCMTSSSTTMPLACSTTRPVTVVFSIWISHCIFVFCLYVIFCHIRYPPTNVCVVDIIYYYVVVCGDIISVIHFSPLCKLADRAVYILLELILFPFFFFI